MGEFPRGRGDAAGKRATNGRRRLLTTAAGIGTASLAGCLGDRDLGDIVVGSTDGSEEPVTIGVLAPDPDGDFIGRSMAQAASVAVDELRNRGGIDGHDVELVVGDTAANPLEARREYHRLILEEGADVTVGVFDSPSLEYLMDDIAEQETLHLTTGAATARASELVREEYDRYKYHFRVGPTNEYDLGLSVVDFVNEMGPEIGWDTIAVLVEDYPWADGPWQVYHEQFPWTSVDVVLEERYPPAIDDFEGLYDRVAEAGADAALVGTAHTGTEALLDWSYPNRPDPDPEPYGFAFGGTHVPMQLPTYWERTGGACRYGFSNVSATATSDVGALTQQFVSDYEDAFGSTPIYTGYHTYEAILMYAEAVEQEGSLDADDLVPALETMSFDGATGTIEFYDRDHDYPHDLEYRKSETLFFQWQERDGEGVQEVIWPEKHATSDYVHPHWV
ncbi:ABC transporter substrate-binding protein [Halopiger goleimassiliensis]|uniref:ABC transporter substrate-binding protein n=1 Tax=Halopiger goleimassiliensis TaxID=1293048 RepID=UPI00067828CC|nr:ABC transporter substrate-binding protein [Halopiger goleimassiliensis]